MVFILSKIKCFFRLLQSAALHLCRCYTLMTFTPLYPIYPTQFDIRQTGFDKIHIFQCYEIASE